MDIAVGKSVVIEKSQGSSTETAGAQREYGQWFFRWITGDLGEGNSLQTWYGTSFPFDTQHGVTSLIVVGKPFMTLWPIGMDLSSHTQVLTRSEVVLNWLR
jgi:hypothetical protein